VGSSLLQPPWNSQTPVTPGRGFSGCQKSSEALTCLDPKMPEMLTPAGGRAEDWGEEAGLKRKEVEA
jgi:hypothetical protein